MRLNTYNADDLLLRNQIFRGHFFNISNDVLLLLVILNIIDNQLNYNKIKISKIKKRVENQFMDLFL